MMHFDVEEIENSPEFGAYLKTAAKHRADLFAQKRAGEKVTPKQNIWSQFKKKVLRSLTGGRCMYCEWPVEGGGDLHVEHYRPKGAVTETHIDRVDQERERLLNHSGYWWLSYEWQNLTLACAWCNTFHSDQKPTSVTEGASGARTKEIWKTHPGKGNEFPVNGERVCNPIEEPIDPGEMQESEMSYEAPRSWWTDLVHEDPLLLHPYKDNPLDHFELDKQVGVLKPKTDKARWTIKVCDLNRPKLVGARAKNAKQVSHTLESIDRGMELLAEDRSDQESTNQFVNDIHAQLREGLVPSRGKGFSFYVELYVRSCSKESAY